MNNKINSRTLTIIILALTILVATATFYYKKTNKKLIFSCSDYNVFMYDKTDSVHAKKNAHLYIYSNGSGFWSEKGIIEIDNQKYHLDRDTHFIYKNHDKDGVISLEYTYLLKRPQDNSPARVWGADSIPGAKYYFTFTEIAPRLLLFRERNTPVAICYSDDI